MPITIEPYQEYDRSEIVEVWERSVRATHHFLTEEEIVFYKTLVGQIDFSALQVYCARNESCQLAGFLGVSQQKLEMLFLHPDQIGKGVGKELMQFAINQLQVNAVDVNEENLQAVRFYERAGFRVVQRKALDDFGKPHPILTMRLQV